MDHRGNHLPDGLQPPAPSVELRRPALAAARAAMNGGRARDRWLRLWTSRPLRVAWATVVVGLIVGNLALDRTVRRATAPVLLSAAGSPDLGELAEIVTLGRVTVELPGWEVVAARGASPNDRKEPS